MRSDSYKPVARRKGLLQTEVSGDLVIIDQVRNRAMSLNPSLAGLLRLCDGKRDIRALSQMLSHDGELPRDEGAIWLALRRLEKAKLLEGNVPAPRIADLPSRRRTLQLLGLGAGALATILMPTPAAALASCEACGHTCTGNGRPCCFPCTCSSPGAASGTCQ